jgi:membrane associated rhomboid family serine protease
MLIAIVVVTLVAYVAQLGFGPSYADHLDAYGPVIRSGQWWRLLTLVLLHVSWVHVGSNMAALAIWGRDTERRFGGWGLLTLYVTTAVASSALAMAVHPDADAVGASGAVFGIMGALVAALWRRRHQPGIPTQLQAVAGFSVISLVLAATIARTDNAAHVAGLLTGVLFGGLLDLALHHDRSRPGAPSGPA